jgi:Mlc titration factor MtfA (ptsG expression regulator)
MVSSWLKKRRLRWLQAHPLPYGWRDILGANMSDWGDLDAGEQRRLGELMQVLLGKTDWFGSGGLVVTDEMRITIAGAASLLLLGLDDLEYSNVETIVVYPSTVLPKRVDPPLFYTPSIVKEPVPLIGEAHRRGPVILAWDAVQRGAAQLDPGHNVVYHEFAHKLDQLDGALDGTPPLATRTQYKRWREVIPREYEALRRRLEQGEATLLDPYAATDLGEFFAVATECFFTCALAMSVAHPELYGLLREFYGQDPSQRQWSRVPAVSAGSL